MILADVVLGQYQLLVNASYGHIGIESRASLILMGGGVVDVGNNQ